MLKKKRFPLPRIHQLLSSNDTGGKKIFFNFFLKIYIPIFLFGNILLVIIFKIEAQYLWKTFQTEETKKVEYISDKIREDLSNGVSDLIYIKFLLTQPLKDSFLSHKEIETLEKSIQLFSQSKKIYAQIRFIDQKGMEKIRINFINGQSVTVPPENLQDKSDRSYFKKTMELNSDEIYISPFDLNVEKNKIETPYIPIIRIATPVFNRDGSKTGFVVLNYLGRKILNHIPPPSSETAFYLLNSNGYYLAGTHPQKTWRFMFPDKEQVRFDQEYPAVWEFLNQSEKGIVKSGKHTFICNTVYPFKDIIVPPKHTTENHSGYDACLRSPANKYKLIIIKHFTKDPIAHLSPQRKMTLWAVAILFNVIFFAIGYLVSKNILSLMLQRKKAEEKLQFTQFAVDHMTDAAYWINTNGNFNYVNGSGVELLAYSAEELLSMNVRDIVPSYSENDWRTHFHQLRNRKFIILETDVLSKSGELIPVRLSANHVNFLNKEYFCSIVIDMRKQKQHEQDLMIAKEKTEAANRAKSEFLSSMSHELRTPLNSIIGFSEVLLEQYFGPLNDKQVEYAQDIFESGRHLLDLINDILDLSKIETGQITLNLECVNISETIQATLLMIKEKSLKHNIRLQFTAGDDVKNTRLIADAGKIKQVMFNLLSNAVKFTPDGGAITVSVQKEKNNILTRVEDSGIGIPDSQKEQVFEAFYQVREGLTNKTPGTGLGLSIIKNFVFMHGGDIWIENTEGSKGTIFTFSLPESPVHLGRPPSEGEKLAPLIQFKSQDVFKKYLEAMVQICQKKGKSLSLSRMVFTPNIQENEIPFITKVLNAHIHDIDIFWLDKMHQYLYITLTHVPPKGTESFLAVIQQQIMRSLTETDIYQDIILDMASDEQISQIL